MTSEEALSAAIDAVRDGDGDTTQDVARTILAALRAAGWAVVPVVATEPSFEEKTAINRAVELRWQRLLNEGKHGMYETLFAIVHEQRADAYRAMLAAARRG